MYLTTASFYKLKAKDPRYRLRFNSIPEATQIDRNKTNNMAKLALVKVFSAICLGIAISNAIIGIEALDNFNKVLDLARNIETIPVGGNEDLLASMARQFLRLNQPKYNAERLKATKEKVEYLEGVTNKIMTSLSNNGWGFNRFMSPLNFHGFDFDKEVETYRASLRGLNEKNFDPEDTPKRYACNIHFFKLKHLQTIFYVLDETMKLLSTNRWISEPAIVHRLSDSNFVTTNDFYRDHEITKNTQEALIDIHRAYNDENSTTMSEIIDLFVKPSPYVIGRITEVCQEVKYYQGYWDETYAKTACAPVPNIFTAEIINQPKVQGLVQLCDKFLISLA